MVNKRSAGNPVSCVHCTLYCPSSAVTTISSVSQKIIMMRRSGVAWSKDFLGISGPCVEWWPRLNQDNNVLSFTQFQPEVILGPILLPSSLSRKTSKQWIVLVQVHLLRCILLFLIPILSYRPSLRHRLLTKGRKDDYFITPPFRELPATSPTTIHSCPPD